MPDDAVVEAASLIASLRRRGFRLFLDESGGPRISPLDRLTAGLTDMLRRRREEIQEALRREAMGEWAIITPWG